MGNDRFWKNQDTKRRNRENHSAARWALEDFRRTGDPSGFPNLRLRLISNRDNFSLSGYGDEDVSPRLTKEEYDLFEEAYKATEEGKNDPVYAPWVDPEDETEAE